jgi:hypothetical protein
MTCQCSGTGRSFDVCEHSGAKIAKTCPECEGSGIRLKTYWAVVLTHKNIGEMCWMNPSLFETKEEADNYKHREYIVIKIMEIRV